MQKKGTLFLLSGPSGVGKGTVRKALFEDPEVNLLYSISATTREMRPGEVDGQDYFFISKERFQELIDQNQMLEYAQYTTNMYGTPKTFIDEQLEKGQDVFMEIEVQGAMKVLEQMPEATYIFLLPPDLSDLRSRLEGRGTESQEVIAQRLAEAKKELAMMKRYDFAVVNDKVEEAVKRIKTIIQAQRMRTHVVADHYAALLEEKEN